MRSVRSISTTRDSSVRARRRISTGFCTTPPSHTGVSSRSARPALRHVTDRLRSTTTGKSDARKCRSGREDGAVFTDVRCCRSGAVGHRQVRGGLSGSGRRMGTSGAESGCGQHSPGDGRGRLVTPTDVGCFGGSATERPNRLRDRPASRRIVGFRLATWDRPVDHRSPRRAHRAARAQSRRQGARGTRAHRLPNGSYATSSTPTPDRSEAMGDHSMPADALISVGRRDATVVVDPRTEPALAPLRLPSLSRQRRSRRTDQTLPRAWDCSGTDQLS
jgi:hypothetical protein